MGAVYDRYYEQVKYALSRRELDGTFDRFYEVVDKCIRCEVSDYLYSIRRGDTEFQWRRMLKSLLQFQRTKKTDGKLKLKKEVKHYLGSLDTVQSAFWWQQDVRSSKYVKIVECYSGTVRFYTTARQELFQTKIK